MAWDIRNLFQPVSPGMSGAVNPLAFIGAGMASGDPGGQLARMGQLQTVGQQNLLNQRLFMMQQQEAERKAKQNQALTAIAPGVAKEMFPTQPNMQAMLAMNPSLLQAAMKQRMAAGRPTSAMQNVLAYQQASPEQRAIMDKMGAFGGGAPGTVVNVGQAGQFGPVPTGMQRVEATESPTGTELLTEPGSPVEKPTEKQMDVAAYVQNAEVAEDMLSKIEGWTPAGTVGAGNMATRLLVGQADKKARDLQLAWTMAVLRAESGAVISPAEAEQQIQVFFEMPGDSAELKKQKRRLRNTKMESMRQRAGRAYKPLEITADAPTAPAVSSPEEIKSIMDKYLPR